MKFQYFNLIAKFSVFVYVLRYIIGYFEVSHVCDVIVTSNVECLYLFWYVWKEETHSYTMVLKKMYVKSTFQVQIVVFTPLVNGVSKMAW